MVKDDTNTIRLLTLEHLQYYIYTQQNILHFIFKSPFIWSVTIC